MPLPCCLIGGTAPRANTRKLESFSIDCCVVCETGFFLRGFYYCENVQSRLRTENDFSRLDERHNADFLWLGLTDPTRMEKDFSCSFEMTNAGERSDPMCGSTGARLHDLHHSGLSASFDLSASQLQL